MAGIWPLLTACQGNALLEKQDSLLLHIVKMPADSQKVKKLFQHCLSLGLSNLPSKLEQLAGEAMQISNKENFKKGRGMALYVRGLAYYGQRDFQKALDTITAALITLENIQENTNSGHCHLLMAHINYDMGNYPAVIVHSEAALDKWKLSGYTVLNGVCHNDMALAYIRMGKYSKAVVYALKAYQICKAIRDKPGMARSLQLMGSSFYDFKDYENAFKNIKAASLINLELKDSFAFARNNNMLGEIYLEQNNLPEAMKLFRQSFDIYSRPDAPLWGMPWGYSNIGSVYEKTADSLQNQRHKNDAAENYAEALKNYKQSLQGFEAIKDPAGSTEQMMFLGRVYYKINEITKAKKYLTECLSLASKIGEKRHLAFTYLYLSKVDSAQNNIRLAYTHYQQHILYRDSVYNQQSLQGLLAYKAQEDAELKDKEITLLETENKLQKAISEKQSQRRNFAYLLTGLLLISGVYIFYRYRRLSKIKAEQKLLKERLAISQDLHDHVGSTLSSISVFSKVAQLQGGENKKEEMNELLGRIRSTSNTLVTEMNDIVWAINPVNDTMEKIIRRMEAYARPLLQARNIAFHFDFDESLFENKIDMEKRKNFYLIFKEAINNAAKYSAAPAVHSSLYRQNGNLLLEIKDNGIGFNPEQAAGTQSLSGNGLRNMQTRAGMIGGQLIIESKSDMGTKILLTCPV